MNPNYPIVVLSHLRWDFVYQRPQHLLSRLAANHKIYYIEEPIFEENTTPRLEASTPAGGVTVYRPFLPTGGHGFSDEQLPLLNTLVQQLVADEQLQDYSYVVWLYTPMALPVAMQLAPMAVVYDCMDELSALVGPGRANGAGSCIIAVGGRCVHGRAEPVQSQRGQA